MALASTDLIQSEEALDKLFDQVGDCPCCAIDTEADSLHRYRESLCLIQFAWEDRSVLIDPLAVENLDRLRDYVGGATVWMHGADYDMTMLKREFGELPEKVFDTQIGARLLGVKKFGLGNLVEHYFDVVLSKSSQKADWGKRPLSDKMVDYALNDVRYLLPMSEMIVSGLKESGRHEWFLESCEWAKAKVLERDDEKSEPWRIQGSGKLDRRGLNRLKFLWEWRDQEAEQWDRPSFMVVTNRQLIEWTGKMGAGGKIELPGHYRSDRRKRFEAMLKAEAKVDAADYPEKIRGIRRRRDKDFDAKVGDLLATRNKLAEDLGIDGSLIASRAMIEAYAADESTLETQWMGWQRRCLGL
ncbi:ribonuclease D [Haloferula rosea]|uniref:HRDC domain-containing protein n=1 Tax=Haloferula rosea TaxID=490093 RepID=A0A934RGJ0_9BACT|nr:ribonuclease D [Haloferula rosea]MBK1828759.1 HRDC domain-containing protein [Haloferula rosea]